MAKNKNKKSQPPSNQEHAYDRAEGFGRGGRGRGRGRGRGGRGGRGGSANDDGGGGSPPQGQDGSRGSGPSNARGGPPSAPGYGLWWRGRGGRGRGLRGVDSGGFTGNFRGGRPAYYPMDEVDFEIQQWNESPRSGRNTPGGRGQGSPLKSNVNNTPRGRGGFVPKLPSSSSLSRLLHEERPLLRPLTFVRSVETATLFQEAEELLEPTVQYPNETAESHAPTADKVSRVFSSTHPHLFDNSHFEIEEGIEEVNFEDLPLVHERVLNSASTSLAPPTVQEQVVVDANQNPASEPEVQREYTTTTETGPSPLFFIDTNPTMSQRQIPVPTYHLHPHIGSLDEDVLVKVEAEPDPEDDVIVYDAPNPRISTPRVEPSTLAKISFSNHVPAPSPRQVNPLRRSKFVHVVGRNARRGSSGIVGVKRKRLSEHKKFAVFGAAIAEARLRSQDGEEDRDPKKHLRRHGDSDLDWGNETDEDGRGDGPVTTTAEGMDLDPDLVGSGVTMTAMKRFSEGINGNHLTMNDLEDVRVGEETSSDSDEGVESKGNNEDEILESDEERMLIEEFIADQYGSDFSDDEEEDELGPMAGFQARLDRLRRKQQKIIDLGEDENEDEMDPDFQWGEGEEIGDFVDGALDEYEKNRTARNAVFRAIQDGFFDELQPKASSSKRRGLPAELQEQWEKDRLAKARRKSERELVRHEAALDSLAPKKGGKKSKMATTAAMRRDPPIETPGQILDMISVEQQIRHFLADKDKKDMALPACGSGMRWRIHNLATLFGLKSESKDGELGRYTTLFKLKGSGKNVDEREVDKLMKKFNRRALDDAFGDEWDDLWKGRGKGKGKAGGKGKGKAKLKDKSENGRLKTREGDVVGQAAPKIDETNIGFTMLTSMGWSDGATIGFSGGLDAPLTAVIKKTKLGLGASVNAKF